MISDILAGEQGQVARERDDPAAGKKTPTCHRSSFDSIMDDGDLEQALENADPTARKVYRDEAKIHRMPVKFLDPVGD